MVVNFNIAQVAQVAMMLRTHKKLYVTTHGQMFTNKLDAEEAVRMKNTILDDANEYAGIIQMTEDQVSKEKLFTYAKDIEKFNALFEKASIPVSKKLDGKKYEKKREEIKNVDKTELDDINTALGLSKPADPAAPVPLASLVGGTAGDPDKNKTKTV